MPNLDFVVRRESGRSGETIAVRLRAIGSEFRDVVRKIADEAVAEGVRVARAEAPRSSVERNRGRRIVDAIQASPVRYTPGGAGGGGFYEADLHASSEIAPHLPFVFEGTAEGGVGKIHPTRGNVLALEKEGERVHFRRWVHGQAPQQQWWDNAERHMNEIVEERISTAKFILGIE